MSTQQSAADEQPRVGRLERKRSRRVQQIAETAAGLFGERGYDAVSLDDVAERLDVTKGSLYYYFANKEQLATAAIETLGNEWTARLEDLDATTTGSAAERLQTLIRAHVSIAVREQPAALRLFLVPRDWPDTQHQKIKELRRRHDAVFRRVIQQGIEEGDFDVPHLDRALQCMHAAMSQSPAFLGNLRGRPLDRGIQELADTLMRLVQRPRRRRP